MKISFNISNNTSNTFSLNKKVMFVLLSVFLTTITTASTTAYAETSIDRDCFQKGITDGEDHPFNQETSSECGDDYYKGFIQGCLSVKGNTIDVCESATDA